MRSAATPRSWNAAEAPSWASANSSPSDRAPRSECRQVERCPALSTRDPERYNRGCVQHGDERMAKRFVQPSAGTALTGAAMIAGLLAAGAAYADRKSTRLN